MSIVESILHLLIKYNHPISTFFVSRISLLFMVYLSLIIIPIQGGEGYWRAFPGNLFIDGLSRWDSGWFFAIAHNGYLNLGEQKDTAFFPFYPIVIGILGRWLDIHLSGIIISNISFMISLLLLYQIVLKDHGHEVADRTVTLLAFNPFSIFFSAVYSESLFIMCVLLSFYWGERRNWILAAISAAAAGATRVVGFLTIVGLALLYLEQIHFNWQGVRKDILWIILSIGGPIGYMLFLGIQFGNPFQFIESQYVAGWGKEVNMQLAVDTIRNSFSVNALVTGQFHAMNLIHLLSAFFALLVLGVGVMYVRLPYILWGLLTVFASFSLWRSMGRYLIVIFPLYIVVALVCKGKQFDFIVYVNILLMGLFSILFSHWYWVA